MILISETIRIYYIGQILVQRNDSGFCFDIRFLQQILRFQHHPVTRTFGHRFQQLCSEHFRHWPLQDCSMLAMYISFLLPVWLQFKVDNWMRNQFV